MTGGAILDFACFNDMARLLQRQASRFNRKGIAMAHWLAGEAASYAAGKAVEKACATKGAAIGAACGGPVGAVAVGAVGWVVGKVVGSALKETFHRNDDKDD